MEFNTFKNEVIRQARAAGLGEYELYYEHMDDTSVGAFQHEVNEFTSAVSGGVCLRCVVDGRMGYASTEELSAQQAAGLVARAMDNARALESDEPAFLCQGGQVYESPDREPLPLPSTQELIAAALDCQDKLYAADSRVVDGCQSEAHTREIEIAICNSKGLDVCYRNNLVCLATVAVVSDGKEAANDIQVAVGALDGIDRAGLTAKAVRAAVDKLGGEPAPTAVCPVVFSPDAMADLLATFSGVFSSENAQKGLSRLGDQEGKDIASPAVTLVDDPFCKDTPLPMPFDAEGWPTRRKNIIEGGRLNTLLYNMKTAAVAGRESTGNAAKMGYAGTVDISPFALYFAPGALTEEELLEKAGSGVYINFLGGLHAGANPVTGDFSLQSAGFLIENGRKTRPVKSFTVAGNFYDLLKKITAVGNNLRFPMPMDITAFGSPSILVNDLSVAGK